jgi:hypothetical protein
MVSCYLPRISGFASGELAVAIHDGVVPLRIVRHGQPRPCVRRPASRWLASASSHPRLASINCLIEAIALAGFRPFGQVRVQFMMVWHR